MERAAGIEHASSAVTADVIPFIPRPCKPTESAGSAQSEGWLAGKLSFGRHAGGAREAGTAPAADSPVRRMRLFAPGGVSECLAPAFRAVKTQIAHINLTVPLIS